MSLTKAQKKRAIVKSLKELVEGNNSFTCLKLRHHGDTDLEWAYGLKFSPEESVFSFRCEDGLTSFSGLLDEETLSGVRQTALCFALAMVETGDL